ncbi:MAG TPA: hypothetical protein DD640_06150 [Clostridiales bacterium]|nr:hypothetical protein [Clostridiales bacterium]
MRAASCRFWLSLKNMRGWLWTPLIFLYALLPSLQRNIQLAARTADIGRLRFFAEAQTFIPLLSIVWHYLFFREYLDHDIAEVLYAADRRPKLRFSVYLCGLYLAAAAPLFIWYVRCYPDSVWEILRLSGQVFFLAALYYGLIYLTRSALLSFGLVLLGSAALIYSLAGTLAEYNLFALETPAGQVPLAACLIYLALAGLFILLGLRRERRFICS